MIVFNEDGRSRSEQTLEERKKIVKQMWDGMSTEEKAVALSMFDEIDSLSTEGNIGFDSVDEILKGAPVFRRLSSEHYEGKIVSAPEFYMDEYYMGAIGKYLFPVWKKDLYTLDNGNYNEIIITGSIGTGKTTFTNLGLIREFYLLCMLNNPQETFGLMPGSEIVLVCFNRDKKLAKDVTFGGVKRMIELSPFFKSLSIKFGNSELVYKDKNLIMLATSVRSSDALGRNVFGGIIDETDFLQGSSLVGAGLSMPGEKPFAERLHESIMTRMKSRYLRSGMLPGKLFMSSSARHKLSFTNKRISAAKNDFNIFVRDYALYEAQPAERFSKKKFWVLAGNERIRHRMLTDDEYDGLEENKRQQLKEKGCRFLHVPEDFRKDFESNIEKSVQDIGGVVTPSMSRFIQLSDRIYDCEDPTLLNPIGVEEWKTGSWLDIDWKRLVRINKRKLSVGVYEEKLFPIRHPDSLRHVHIDLSRGMSDPAGICIAHIVDTIEVRRRNVTGEDYLEEVPIMEVDLMLRIKPPRDGEIDFGEIRGIVYAFMQHGYSIPIVTLDSWQSADSIQSFKKQGINSFIVSTWKILDPYEYLKTSIYEGRISWYRNKIIKEELENLEKDEEKQRVDHPVGGSKDVADALAGVVYTLSTKVSGMLDKVATYGISEYGKQDNSRYIRETMTSIGDEPLIPVDDPSRMSGPIIITG